MKTHSAFLRLIPRTLGVICLASGWHGRAAIISWTNTAGGNWSTASNWSPNQVPGPSDTANINAAGTYAITLDASANVENLALGGAASGVQTSWNRRGRLA